MAFLRLFTRNFGLINSKFIRQFATQDSTDNYAYDQFSLLNKPSIELSDIVEISHKILKNQKKIADLELMLKYCRASMFKNITDRHANILLWAIRDNFNPTHNYLMKGLGYIQEGVGINLYKYLDTPNTYIDSILAHLAELEKKSNMTTHHKLKGALIGYIMVTENPLVKAKQIYDATRLIQKPESVKKYKIAYERIGAKIDPEEFSRLEKKNADFILKSFKLAQEVCPDIKFEIPNTKL